MKPQGRTSFSQEQVFFGGQIQSPVITIADVGRTLNSILA